MNSLAKSADIQTLQECSDELDITLSDGRSFHIPRRILPYFDDKYSLQRNAEFIMIANLPRPLDVFIDDENFTMHFDGGRKVTIPTRWYPRLWLATEEKRNQFELTDISLHWPELDEDILVIDLLLGGPSAESSESIQKWLKRENAFGQSLRQNEQTREIA